VGRVPDADVLQAFPKVSLHDHLDGGLRAATILELAAESGHELPASDPDALARWFAQAADSGSLELYLETFDHTIAVMQTPEHLQRVAREFVEDLAADGVVYGEARWAPEQHLRAGLTMRQAVEAVRDGLAEGMRACAAEGREIEVRQLVTAMRHVPKPTREVAELAIDLRDHGVAGFDIAGAERGFGAERFLDSFRHLQHQCGYYTIHAGEADGVESIRSAVAVCGAHRIGHGVALTQDIDLTVDPPGVGVLAEYVRLRDITLEMCPSSNVQTGAVASLAEHPIRLLDDLGFGVSVNCDNRLMSATWLSREFDLVCQAFDWDLEDVRRLSLNAARGAFSSWSTRRRLLERIASF
jgi:adenosine deaminase